MATFWLGVILSSVLLVFSDQGVEHLNQLHCKPKPGCTLAKCAPIPDQWSLIEGLNPPSHEYPILCQNTEDSSCCGKQLTTMKQNFEEMKSGFKREVLKLELRLEMTEKREAEARLEMKSEYKRDLLKLELRLEMTEKREAEARLEISLLENENSEIKEEVENLKRESTAIKRAADEKIALLEREQSEIKEEANNLEKETRAIRSMADGNKKELQSRIESVEKMVTQLISKQTVPQINQTDRTMGEVTTTETAATDETTAKCDGILKERKCYFAVFHERKDVRLSDGNRLCADSGGKSADILNVDHQNAVENYIRGLIPSSRSNIWLWTAMTYNTRQLRSSSGDSRSLQWHDGYPSSISAWTAVRIIVHRDATSSFNGVFNHSPTGTTYGYICEI